MSSVATAKAFASRLNEACDASPDIPPHGKGRQTVLADKVGVSQEAARKWFAGLSMPRAEKMKKLSEIVNVDQAWLALGVKPELSLDGKKLAARVAEGSVMLVAGMLQVRGANCFFPTMDDPRRHYVHIYADIRGVMYPIHVCNTKEVSSGVYEVLIPHEYSDVRCVGFMPSSGPTNAMLDMPTEMIDRLKVRRNLDFTVTIDLVDGEYLTLGEVWPKFNTLGGLHDH